MASLAQTPAPSPLRSFAMTVDRIWVTTIQPFMYHIMLLAILYFCYVILHSKMVSKLGYTGIWHPQVIVGVYGVLAIAFWTALRTMDSGRVRQELELYPYDYVLYHPQLCPTCKVRKPARSKHCKYCNFCVHRFDHHCGFLNRCIALHSYRWFMLFLVYHILMLNHGIYICIQLMQIHLQEFIASVVKYSRTTNTPIPPNIYILNQVSLKSFIMQLSIQWSTQFPMLLLCIILSVMSFTVGVFAMHQLYLVSINKTLNETYKWEAIIAGIKDGSLSKEVDKAGGKTKEIWSRLKKDSKGVPVNIYNIGMVENLAEVFMPSTIQGIKKRT